MGDDSVRMSDPATNRALVRSLLIDGSILSGSALVSAGAALIYQPAGYIAAGLLLLSFGLNAAKAKGAQE
jgi:hypothetical protein